ncbi:hypothetical protein N9Y36_04820 [Ulvibacter sp.]|nr:hypothetical protein [Ulvibacter sp.]
MIKHFLIFIIFSSIPLNTLGQETRNSSIQEVFNKLVNTYGSAKQKPKLVVRTSKSSKPAEYIAKDATIFIDNYVFTLSKELGKDQLNVLSIIISHELAHYYFDHTFCTDYAVATRNLNKELAKDIRDSSMDSRIEKETEADQKGLFYAAAAGYNPFDLYPEFITRLYNAYQLPDELEGYPSKQQRIKLAEDADDKAIELYDYFQEGLNAIKNKQYEKAIKSFENANRYIPFRENYNNIGVAKTRIAIKLKVSKNENEKRFKYPIEIDYESRLKQNKTRSIANGEKKMTMLLKSAKEDFDKAIRLDPKYTQAYINLACVYDLLENYYGAIGTIKDLYEITSETKDAQRILAIAYYHADMEDKAEIIWNKLKI